MVDIEDFLARVVLWAADETDVRGVLLVGSHARRSAGPDSDVDLVLLTRIVQTRCTDTDWAADFGRVSTLAVEDWVGVQSVRVHYEMGLEVEFGWASPSWAALPLDPGTAAVLADGHRILHDPEGLLDRAAGALDDEWPTIR